MVFTEEMSKIGSAGVLAGLATGTAVGLPPVMNYGSPELRERIVSDCLLGEKMICLAITEPWAGSDVANLKTTAVLDGDYYVVNGMKKWITNGIWCDYFTTAVRTSD